MFKRCAKSSIDILNNNNCCHSQVLKLLTCENEINFSSLTHHFYRDTIKTWLKNQYSVNLKIVGRFTPEATIFTDASVTGFGAYLIMEGRDKVRLFLNHFAFCFYLDLLYENTTI